MAKEGGLDIDSVFRKKQKQENMPWLFSTTSLIIGTMQFCIYTFLYMRTSDSNILSWHTGW
jgi:hypothetical protein